MQVNFSANNEWAFACSYPLACTLFTGSCPTGQACHISDGENGIVVCDSPSGTEVPEGGQCQYRNDCGDSQQCATVAPDNSDAGTGHSCRYNCQFDAWQTLEPGLGGCPPTQTCHDLGLDQLPNVGICVPA
jgi:hypothetical protein